MVQGREPVLQHRAGRHRIERHHLDAACLQFLEEFLRRLVRAHRVVDEAHLHARLGARDERRGELLADIVGLEDVRLHVDVVLGTPDGGEHRGVRVGPVLEKDHTVADAERAAGERFLDGDVLLERTAIRRFGLELLDDRLALLRREDSATALEAHVVGADLLRLQEIAVDRRRRARAEEQDERRDAGGAKKR